MLIYHLAVQKEFIMKIQKIMTKTPLKKCLIVKLNVKLKQIKPAFAVWAISHARKYIEIAAL